MKRIYCFVLAFVFAMLCVVPSFAVSGLITVDRSYSAGYTTPNLNYFDTGNLTKTSSYYWNTASDENTETYFIDANGNVIPETSPFHYTSLYAGGYLVCSNQYVASGATFTFPNSVLSQKHNGTTYYYTYNTLRLRISNGSSIYYYKTCGTFSATKHLAS